MNYKNIVSVNGTRKGVITLYSEITENEARYFVEDITYLASQVQNIEVRINSIGGDIIAGFSIFSCITRLINEGIKIETFNDGLCASVAGWLFQAGSVRNSADFSLFMMHDPYNSTDTKIDNENEIVKKFKGSIVAILEKNSTFTSEELAKMMKGSGTWLDATELLANKMTDKIFSNSLSRKLKNTFTKKSPLHSLYNIANQLYLPKKTSYMKINNLLKLQEEASEDAQIQAIVSLQNKAKESEELKIKVGEQKALIESLENSLKQAQKSKIDATIQNAIEKGQITEAQKESWENLLTLDFENSSKALAGIVIANPHVDLRNAVKNEGNAQNSQDLAKQYDTLQKNDPKKLMEIKNSQPELFASMLKEYRNSIK
jgi:ATP-dependent protease ClpP protease subunit